MPVVVTPEGTDGVISIQEVCDLREDLLESLHTSLGNASRSNAHPVAIPRVLTGSSIVEDGRTSRDVLDRNFGISIRSTLDGPLMSSNLPDELTEGSRRGEVAQEVDSGLVALEVESNCVGSSVGNFLGNDLDNGEGVGGRGSQGGANFEPECMLGNCACRRVGGAAEVDILNLLAA